MVGPLIDITNLAESDDALRTAIAAGEHLEALLATIVRSMEATDPGLIASIMLVDDTGKHLRHGAAPSLPTIFNDAVDGLEIGPGIGCCGQAAYTGKRVVVSDTGTHPNWAPFRDLARVANIKSSASQPVFSTDGKHVLATVAIYHANLGAPSEDEFTLLGRAMSLARMAIEHHQAVPPR